MEVLDGRKIADNILADLKNKLEQEKLHPVLGVVLVGTDEASRIYVNLKERAAEKVGIGFCKIEMNENSSEEEILQKITELNNDSEINGIIVQLPLPKQLDKIKIIQTIDPKKDVDGFHEDNIELFFAGKERFFPVFPKAILELIKSAGTQNVETQNVETRLIASLRGKKAIIICNSQEFGKTMQAVLKGEKISAQYFFQDDVQDNLVDFSEADIVITACGVPNLIQGEMLQDGVVVIDGGITRVGDKVVGDVDVESVKFLNGFISPVPGGVGPVTIACLLQNTYLATKN
jgi:methylenetetrahydrofolate dehydrogenase (NADP+)/methenyltetrahydrofolate cyclohydrolase